MRKLLLLRLSILCSLIGVLLACNNTVNDQVVFTNGNANFSKVVIVGSNTMAGYANSGITPGQQVNGVANLLLQQFQQLGGATTSYPMINELNGTTIQQLESVFIDSCGILRTNVQFIGENTTWNYANTGQQFNVLCTPNVSVGLLNSATINDNPFFNKLNTNTSSYTEWLGNQISDSSPSFFVLNMGWQDILRFATTGGGYQQNTPIANIELTDTALFRQNYRQLLTLLTADNAKGIALNIPNVEDMPFLAEQGVVLLGRDSCTQELPIYITRANGSVAIANFNSNAIYNDLILFAASSQLGEGTYGISENNPLANSEVLDKGEATQVGEYTMAYNQIISELTAEFNVPLFDVNSFYSQLSDGTSQSGLPINNRYILGNYYSLDGVNPTALGGAVLANAILASIDTSFNANTPKLDITKYPAIDF